MMMIIDPNLDIYDYTLNEDVAWVEFNDDIDEIHVKHVVVNVLPITHLQLIHLAFGSTIQSNSINVLLFTLKKQTFNQ
jgi:hypothetical protein